MSLSISKKRELLKYFDAEKEKRVPTEEELEAHKKLWRNIRGIAIITSRKSMSSHYVLEEDQVNDELTCNYNCDACGRTIRIYKRDLPKVSSDWVICPKPSCEYKMDGDDVPILTEDNILHYKGMSLTEEDLQ